MRELPWVVDDPLGLHVQLAVLIASEAKRWRSKVTMEYDGQYVDATQPLEMMMLGVRSGENVTIYVEGVDEDTASGELARLISTF